MNRNLKERIVGATVIVALGIIIIPWLLDGPAQAPRPVEQSLELPSVQQSGRTFTIPLDPAAGPPVQVEPDEAPQLLPNQPNGVVRRSGENAAADLSPPPATEPSRAAQPPSQPPPRPAPQPVERKAAEPTPAPQPAVAAESWAVQVGSFSQADNARALQRQLAAADFEAFISRVATDAGTMHRVRVGPVKDRAEADRMLSTLRAAGHAGARVVQAQD